MSGTLSRVPARLARPSSGYHYRGSRSRLGGRPSPCKPLFALAFFIASSLLKSVCSSSVSLRMVLTCEVSFSGAVFCMAPVHGWSVYTVCPLTMHLLTKSWPAAAVGIATQTRSGRIVRISSPRLLVRRNNNTQGLSVRDRGSGAGAGDQALVLAYPYAAPWHARRGASSVLPKDRQKEKTPARCRRFKAGGVGSVDVLPVTRLPVSCVLGLHAVPVLVG